MKPEYFMALQSWWPCTYIKYFSRTWAVKRRNWCGEGHQLELRRISSYLSACVCRWSLWINIVVRSFVLTINKCRDVLLPLMDGKLTSIVCTIRTAVRWFTSSRIGLDDMQSPSSDKWMVMSLIVAREKWSIVWHMLPT